jgi:hypothetical protein
VYGAENPMGIASDNSNAETSVIDSIVFDLCNFSFLLSRYISDNLMKP